MTSRHGEARRDDRTGPWVTITNRFNDVLSGQFDAVVAGHALLVVCGLIVTIAGPLVAPSAHSLILLAGVTLAMTATFGLTLIVPWRRLHPRATLAFPLLVLVGLCVLAVVSPTASAPLTGLISLCFAYLGLTQPPRTSLIMLPAAIITFVLANQGLSYPIVVRLVIGTIIWTILGEVLARLMARSAEATAALRSAAHTDALTGVANRRDLQIRLALTRPGDAVVICDLDNFKALNDSQGHTVGDLVLADFGAMLRATLRADDYCARYGGEEFVLVLPQSSVAEVVRVVARLRLNWSVMRPGVTFSAGIALCTGDRDHDETLDFADAALYAAKAAGRNCDRAADLAIA